jgi:hypothetical protein
MKMECQKSPNANSNPMAAAAAISKGAAAQWIAHETDRQTPILSVSAETFAGRVADLFVIELVTVGPEMENMRDPWGRRRRAPGSGSSAAPPKLWKCCVEERGGS